MSVLSRARRDGSVHKPRLGLGGDLAGPVSPNRTIDVGEPINVAPAADEAAPRRSLLARARSSREHILNDDNPQATWTTGSRLGTRAATVLALAALAAGPVSLGWQALRPEAVPVAAAGDVDDRLLSRRSVASEVAAQWVTKWASTPEARAGELRDMFTGQVTLPKAASTVSNVRVVDAVASDVGVWAVTVAADMTAPGAKTPVRRYFQVPVAVAGDAGDVAGSPMAAPAPVPAPGATTYEPGGYGATVTTDSPLGQAVTSFLTEGLTGADVTRYVTPTTALPRLVSPAAAYGSARVLDIKADADADGARTAQAPSDGARVRVMATVELRERGPANAAGAGLSATYPLSLTARGGRWEVSGIDTALARTH